MKKSTRLLRCGFLCVTVFYMSALSAQFIYKDSTLAKGDTVHMKVNTKTGVPHRITGLNIDLRRYGQLTGVNIPAISEAFLREYAVIFRVDPGSLVIEKNERVKERWLVNYVQEYNGIPVYGSSVGFTVNANGRIPVVGIQYYPHIDVNTTPSLSAPEAVEIAVTDFAARGLSDSIVIDSSPELVVLPVEKNDKYEYVLTYRLELDTYEGGYSESYFIDATNGSIEKKYSNVLRGTLYGCIQYRYWPEHHDDSEVTT